MVYSDVDQSYLQEPPETPAPLFAVRAFKTALFGTPAPSTQEIYNNDPLTEARAMGDAASKPSIPFHRMNNIESNFNTKSKPDIFASPAKGILLTPGTGAARRKTVSFGALTANKESTVGQILKNNGDTELVLEDSLAAPPSTIFHASQSRQTSLNKKLFETRDGAEETTSTQPIVLQMTPSEAHDGRQNMQVKAPLITSDQDVSEVDVTVDLKDPRSRSGRHWKREYTRYHEKSDHEMRKLIKYSQIAKSYAVKRDSEALNLGEKLKKALSQVTDMEGRISELAGKLAENGSQVDDAPDQAQMMSQLTMQTAQALRYKQKADKYEKAIREHQMQPTPDHSKDNPRTEQQHQIGTSEMLGPEQSRELSSLRLEVAKLRSSAEDAEGKAAHLESQNLALKNNILRVKEEMKKYETRHRIREERRKQSDEKAKAQKRKLEADLAQCKVDYEKLMAGQGIAKVKQIHNTEVPNGGGENDYTRGINEIDLPATSTEELIEDLRRQIGMLKEEAQNLRPDLLQQHQRKVAQDLRHAQEDLRNCRNENVALKQRAKSAAVSHFDQHTATNDQNYADQVKEAGIWTDVIETKSTSHDAPYQTRKVSKANDNDTDHVRQHALKELNQNNVKQQNSVHTGASPQRSKASEVLEINKDLAPSTLQSLPSTDPHNPVKYQRQGGQASYPASPRPSLLGFTPQPPKRLSSRPRVETSRLPSDDHQHPRVGTRRGYSTLVASSRLGSMAGGNGRSLLPPDRAAAARLRLEQRKADKQGGQGSGKENPGL